jgi:hypothetical protein
VKMHRMRDPDGSPVGYMIFCPGCKCCHGIWVDKPDPVNGCHWSFSGDLERPSFSPSLLISGVCHSFIRDGRIEFLSDCKHELAGKTVDLPDFDEQ